MKTIFLTDGETHVREALSLMLKHQAEFKIVGQASTPESTLAQVCQQPPDVILLDWNLPGLHHQRLIDALHQCCPQTIILATSVKPEQESGAMKSGVDAFLLKQLPPDQFIDALRTAVNQQDASE
jgi:two-component system nitrate/nitrite response regulator NarL